MLKPRAIEKTLLDYVWLLFLWSKADKEIVTKQFSAECLQDQRPTISAFKGFNNLQHLIQLQRKRNQTKRYEIAWLLIDCTLSAYYASTIV